MTNNRRLYSNDYETYKIIKMNFNNEIFYMITDLDETPADGRYKTLKEAKTAIDNQDVWF